MLTSTYEKLREGGSLRAVAEALGDERDLLRCRKAAARLGIKPADCWKYSPTDITRLLVELIERTPSRSRTLNWEEPSARSLFRETTRCGR